jgi:hypothetical protein
LDEAQVIHLESVVSVVGMVVTVVVVVASAVWAISSIKNVTTKLSAELSHLSAAVIRLTVRLDQIERIVHDQSVQIARLEGTRSGIGRSQANKRE